MARFHFFHGGMEILIFTFLVGRKLLYSVVLVSAIKQCESAIIIYISPPSLLREVYILPSSPSIPPLWIITECQAGLLCYIATSHWLYLFTHGSVCMSALLPPFIPPSPSPLTWWTSPFSTRFIRTLFLEFIHIYICINIQYLSFPFWFT